MKMNVKQHGYAWFFKGADVGGYDFGNDYPACPECENDGDNGDDILVGIDLGLPKKVGNKYTQVQRQVIQQMKEFTRRLLLSSCYIKFKLEK
jgi:hypothetical protein